MRSDFSLRASVVAFSAVQVQVVKIIPSRLRASWEAPWEKNEKTDWGMLRRSS